MDLRISKILSDYLNGKIKNLDFEKWIYSEGSLENQLGEELYIEVVSLDFKDKSIRHNIEKLVDSKIDYGNLHKQEIIELIDNTLGKRIPLMNSLYSFYDWLTKGYNFFGEINVIGNFGEQGKSIAHIIDESMSENKKWGKLLYEEPEFLPHIIEIKDKLITGKIILTGERKISQIIKNQYNYTENLKQH